MDVFLGQISLFGGDYAPAGWAFCNGQMLNISDHTALFSLLGTRYGGDGVNTFALPNLCGRMPLGFGTAQGLSNYPIGSQGGKEKVALGISEMPAHNHGVSTHASALDGIGANTIEVTNNYWAKGGSYSTTSDAQMANDAVRITDTGEGKAHENRPPYLALNFMIALNGIYPSRS
ncbi:phage tail protein [Mesonia sediminis]|uniref:Phage tail protein n=1 Tax=Mesonia sediminis TaxID=1703946 RepID=A0ABW5SDT3_9FLAO